MPSDTSKRILRSARLATTTHRQLSEAELENAGVSIDLARLSIGIEHVDDILADISQALQAVKR